jgi:hypothetical protein
VNDTQMSSLSLDIKGDSLVATVGTQPGIITTHILRSKHNYGHDSKSTLTKEARPRAVLVLLTASGAESRWSYSAV